MKKENLSPQDELLPDYGQSYLNHLVGRYRASTLPTKDMNESDEEIIKKLLKKESTPLTWGDLLVFEMTILKNLTLDELRRELHALRQKYRDVAGQQAYDEYLKTSPPDIDDTKTHELELRADLNNILSQVYWLYASTPAREKKRNRLTLWAAVMPALLLALIAVSLGYAIVNKKDSAIPTYILVCLAGAIGGFISMQRRLQGASRGGDPIDDLSNLTYGRFSFYLAPISGAFFSLVLYMIFTAGLIEGTIFPHIVTPLENSPKGLPFKEFAEGTGARTGADFAKLLVWSFVAGFAERFVPDTLNWLIEKKEKASIKKGTS